MKVIKKKGDAMKKNDKAIQNLKKTGWHSGQVALELGVSQRIARMYLSGERKIPSKLQPLIPIIQYSGDTHLKSRIKKEKRINELKKFSISVPFKN